MKTEKNQLKRSTLTESYFGCILLYNLFIYMYIILPVSRDKKYEKKWQEPLR